MPVPGRRHPPRRGASPARPGRVRRLRHLRASLPRAPPPPNARGHGAVSGPAVALKLGPLDLLEPASALSAALASGLAGAWLLAALPIVLFGLPLGPPPSPSAGPRGR